MLLLIQKLGNLTKSLIDETNSVIEQTVYLETEYE